MTVPTPPPRLTALEDRTVPSAFSLGDPWPDAGGITISFAPDGTKAGGAGSGLFSTLDKTAKGGGWQVELLRGFQSWAAVSNLNVGLVGDDGDPFGTPGDVEGDYRFGDIRVGARPLSADALANAVPFSWGAGTWAGDVLLNTGVKFGINPAQPGVYDLFTVAAHEAGHCFGLAHSDAPGSVLGEDYAGTKAGLAASDVARVQALYGARLPDRFEGTTGNNGWDTATVLSGTGNLQVAADLTTAADADYYRFLTPAKPGRVTVRLATSGVSLLTAKVTVYDAAGRAVGADVSTDPRSGDLEVKLDHPTGGSFYTVRVEAARADVFGVGRYTLAVVYKPVAAAKVDANDRGTNDTPAGATVLFADAGDGGGNGFGWGSDGAVYGGQLENKLDADYYRVTAPADGGPVLVVRVRGTGPQTVPPVVTVFDADMNPVAARVVERNGSALTLQVEGVQRGRDYFIRVQGNGTDATTGAYRLRAAFTAPRADDLATLLGGGLGGSATTATGRLSLASSSLFQFQLAAAGAAGATVTLTVTDAKGKVVATLAQAAGFGPGLLTAYLPAGEYTVTVRLTLPKGMTTQGVNYRLTGGVASDPIGPYGTTTSTTPTTTPTTPTTTTPPPTPPPTPTPTTTPLTTTAPTTYTFTPTVRPPLTFPYSF